MMCACLCVCVGVRVHARWHWDLRLSLLETQLLGADLVGVCMGVQLGEEDGTTTCCLFRTLTQLLKDLSRVTVHVYVLQSTEPS